MLRARFVTIGKCHRTVLQDGRWVAQDSGRVAQDSALDSRLVAQANNTVQFLLLLPLFIVVIVSVWML